MKYIFTLAILISFSLQGQVVCFDRSLSQPVYIDDPGPSGMSQFTNFLYNNRVKKVMTVANGKYADIVRGDTDFSSMILIITPSIHREYTNYAVNDFKHFLNEGAHLVLVAEHENYYFNADNLNKICEPFGIKINNNAIKTATGNEFESAWPIGKSEKYGVENIRFYLPASLTCGKGVERIATIDTNVVCASVKVGKGRLTVLGDYEMLWNMTPKHGINYGDNKEFLIKLLDIPRTSTIEYTDTKQFVHWLKDKADSLSPSKFLVAEEIEDFSKLTKEDVVFFVKPTTQLSWPDSIFKKIKKAVFVGGEYSNYVKMLSNEGGINIVNALGYKHEDLPINTIGKHFGVQFSESVVNGGGLNDIVINSEPNCCNEYYISFAGTKTAGSIVTTSTKDFTTVYKTKGDCKELDYYGPLGFDESLGKNATIPMPGGVITNIALCQYNSRTFVITSDVLWDELIIGERKGNGMLDAFKKWVKAK